MATAEDLSIRLRMTGDSQVVSAVKRINDSYVDLRQKMLDIVGVGQKLFDAVSDGAKTQRVQKSFELMSVSAEGYLKQLKEVSNGTVSSFDLMQASNKALALGIQQDNIPQLLEIARSSAILMGRDVNESFEDIVTGVARASPLILDNLGFIIKGLDGASDSSKVMQAVLEDGNRMLEITASVSGDAADDVARAAAALDDLKRAGLGVLTKLSPLISQFAEGATIMARAIGVDLRTTGEKLNIAKEDLRIARLELKDLQKLQETSNMNLQFAIEQKVQENALLAEKVKSLADEVNLENTRNQQRDDEIKKRRAAAELAKAEAERRKEAIDRQKELVKRFPTIEGGVSEEDFENLKTRAAIEADSIRAELHDSEMDRMLERQQLEIDAIQREYARIGQTEEVETLITEIKKAHARERTALANETKEAESNKMQATMSEAYGAAKAFAAVANQLVKSRSLMATIEAIWCIAQAIRNTAEAIDGGGAQKAFAAAKYYLAAMQYGMIAGSSFATASAGGGGGGSYGGYAGRQRETAAESNRGGGGALTVNVTINGNTTEDTVNDIIDSINEASGRNSRLH